MFKLGVPIDDVYRALQTLLGGYYVNQFNRFGRVWKVFVEAEPQYRTKTTDVGQFYVRNKQGAMVPLSTLVDMQRVFGPEYTTRFNEYRSIEIFALPAPGYSTGDAMKAIDRGRQPGPAARHGLRLERHLLPAVGRGRRRRSLRAVDGAGVSDPRRAL